MGLEWEHPILRQSDRFDAYRGAAERLHDAGLLYPCFASRKEIAQASHGSKLGLDPDGAALYPGLHRELSDRQIESYRAEGRSPAMRIDMDAAVARLETETGARTLPFATLEEDGEISQRVADPSRWGDAVIQRKDVPTSYHLSVVVDDAFQGVTHVVRGKDLLAATDLPPAYHHHRVLKDPLGRKLSKSAGATALRKLREDGVTADEICQRLGF